MLLVLVRVMRLMKAILLLLSCLLGYLGLILIILLLAGEGRVYRCCRRTRYMVGDLRVFIRDVCSVIPFKGGVIYRQQLILFLSFSILLFNDLIDIVRGYKFIKKEICCY